MCFPMLGHVGSTRIMYWVLGLTIRREQGLDLGYGGTISTSTVNDAARFAREQLIKYN